MILLENIPYLNCYSNDASTLVLSGFCRSLFYIIIKFNGISNATLCQDTMVNIKVSMP